MESKGIFEDRWKVLPTVSHYLKRLGENLLVWLDIEHKHFIQA